MLRIISFTANNAPRLTAAIAELAERGDVQVIYLILNARFEEAAYLVQGALMHYVEFGAPRGHAIDYTGIEFH